MQRKIQENIKYLFITLLGWCYIIQSVAQKPVINNLVFEGGGMRGISYCGALSVLEDKGLMAGILKTGGTSAGALTAMCVAVGYTAHEMNDILNNTRYSSLKDGFFLCGPARLKKYYGWYKGNKLTDWIGKMLEHKTGNADISFAQMYQLGFKELTVAVNSINEQKVVYLNRHNYPDMKVKDAVRASMGIPLYFTATFFDSSGKRIKKPGRQQMQHLNVYTDALLTGNFPIRMFDSVYLENEALQIKYNPGTLAFRIDDSLQIMNDYAAHGKFRPMPVTGLKTYLIAIKKMVLETANRSNLMSADWQRTISIEDADISPYIKKMKAATIQLLYNKGKMAAEAYFKKNGY